MRAIVLAAGYATRLRPLTDSIPKQLLPIGGRPMMDWVCDKLEEVTGDIHVVTNSRFAGDFERWAGGRDGITVHDDGTTLQRRPAGRDRRHRVRARADGRRRRPARDRGRQPVRLQPQRPGRLRALERSCERAGGLRLRGSRAGDAVRRRRGRRRRPGALVRGEACEAAEHPRRHGDATSTTGSTCRWSGATSRRETAPTSRGCSFAWLYAREPVYGYRFERRLVRHRQSRAAARGRQPLACAARASGTRRVHARLTLATFASLPRPSCRSRRAAHLRHGFGTDMCTAAVYRGAGAARPAPAAALRRLRPPGATACPRCTASLPRLTGTLCARCGAPVAWPVERCRECAGRRLAFASARAAVEYDEAVRALVSAWKERGLRGIATLAASLADEVVARPVTPRSSRSFHPTETGASAGATIRRRGSRASSVAAGPCRWSRSLGRTRPLRPQRGLARGRAAPERPRRVPCAARPAAGSCSSTTSTRPARPSRPRRRPCARPGPPASTWSRSRVRCADEID